MELEHQRNIVFPLVVFLQRFVTTIYMFQSNRLMSVVIHFYSVYYSEIYNYIV